MNKNKTVSIFLILLLTVSAAIVVSAVQFEAHAQIIDIPTFLFVTAAPNPVGVGQVVYVGATFSRPTPTGAGWRGDLYEDVTIDIIDPSGHKTVYGPYVMSAVAGVTFSYTPDVAGNYTLQAHYPGQVLDGTNYMYPEVSGMNLNLLGSTMLPDDSDIITLVVQDEPVTAHYKTPPLPTEFWVRPIYATNWNWGELGSNWFGTLGNVLPAGYAPNSPHVAWTRPTSWGGQPGWPIPADESTQYSSTSLLQTYFEGECILNGILYYNTWTAIRGSGMAQSGSLLGWEAVDVHTGETVWSRPAGITDNERIDWGQIVNYNNFQEFGSNAFLWSAPGMGGFGMGGGAWAGIYDAVTGEFLANVTNPRSGTRMIDWTADLKGAIITYYTSGGNLCLYNTTELLRVHGGMDDQFFRPTGTIDGRMPETIVWSVPIVDTFNGDDINLGIAGVTEDIVLLRQVPGSVAWQGTNAGYDYVAGYDARTGARLWGPINQTGIWNAYEDTSLIAYGEGYYVYHNKDRNIAWGFDLTNGQKVWGPVQLVGEGGYSSVWRDGEIAYGKVYIWDLGGYVNAIDLETGDLAWTYYAGNAGYDTPFQSYPFFGYNRHSIADGKLFLSQGIMYTPPVHPAYKTAINCTDGSLVWKLSMYSPTNTGIFGDGYLIQWNSFDNQIYSIGKGPTATTVTIQDDVVTLGDSVLVKGTVMDKSGGTEQDVITTRFPDGLPAVSEGSMQAWMEYAYQQQIKPADAVGVEVDISVLDPNGNCYSVGTTTSDSSGLYSLAFTPEVPGKYTIYATFEGSTSYYGSFAENAINVEDAPEATPAPTPTPAPMTDTYVMGFGIALLIAVIIGFALLFLLLRRR